MENILQWGLDFIRQIQGQGSPALTAIMIGITWLGSAAAYLILIPLIYWCVDEKKGFRLGLAILISAWLNITMKFLFDQPRPYFSAYDPTLQLIPEKMGGLPSGHAQNALVMWVIIASWLHRKWAYIAAALICLAVSFSRMYLGVHFPSDILAGWFLGGAVLCVYFLLGRKIQDILEKGGFRARMISIALVSFIMILYRPTEDFLIPGALLLGLGSGYILNLRYVQFESSVISAAKPAVQFLHKAARVIIGLIVTGLIHIVFREIIPLVRGTSLFVLAYFLQYGLIGLWMSIGAPWLFFVMRIAKKQAHEE